MKITLLCFFTPKRCPENKLQRTKKIEYYFSDYFPTNTQFGPNYGKHEILYRFILNVFCNKGRFQKKKKYGIFHTLVGWVGLKKSFSIKDKNKKHGLKMPKIA